MKSKVHNIPKIKDLFLKKITHLFCYIRLLRGDFRSGMFAAMVDYVGRGGGYGGCVGRGGFETMGL